MEDCFQDTLRSVRVHGQTLWPDKRSCLVPTSPTIGVSNLRLQLAELQTQLEEHNQACVAREKYEVYRRAKLHRIVGDLMASLRQV